MPSTSTTKIYYVDPSATSLSKHLALISPLVHINGDNAYSPQLPDTQKLLGDLEYFPHTSNDTLPSQHPAKLSRLQNQQA